MGGSPYIMYDGARVSRESDLGRELEKWERKPGWKASDHPYPAMLYKAQHRPDGKRSVGEVRDSLFPEQGEKGPFIVAGAAEQWSRRCQKTVNDESEYLLAYGQGWRSTPQEALDLLEREDNAGSNATAARHAADARMSERAQAEAAAVDQTTLKQVPEIPVKRQLSPEAKQKMRDNLAKARAARAAKKQPPV